MSAFFFLFVSLVVSTFAANSTYTLRYNSSLDEWQTLKQENGDCYTYCTTFTSFSGHGSSTTIKVENGIVIERSYESHTWNNINGEKTITGSWKENTTQSIGTNSGGSDAKTMDELYENCPNYINLDEENNYIYFKTNQLNIMIQCGYFPKNCADDCYSGISIQSFYFCPTTSIISTCDVMIDGIILDSSQQNNIGDTLIIKVYNTANNNIFSYPFFKIYVVNNNDYILFGTEDVFYYGIGSNIQPHTIISNTSTINTGSMVRLYIELWTGTTDPVKQCTFNWYGIPISNISAIPSTTSSATSSATSSTTSSLTSSITPKTSGMSVKKVFISITSMIAMVSIIL